MLISRIARRAGVLTLVGCGLVMAGCSDDSNAPEESNPDTIADEEVIDGGVGGTGVPEDVGDGGGEGGARSPSGTATGGSDGGTDTGGDSGTDVGEVEDEVDEDVTGGG